MVEGMQICYLCGEACSMLMCAGGDITPLRCAPRMLIETLFPNSEVCIQLTRKR